SPSIPTGLSAGVVSSSQINLAWSASTDPDDAVAGYRISRDGYLHAFSPTPSFSDTGLLPGKSYDYSVLAMDTAGNPSELSSDVVATTPGSSAFPVIALTKSANRQSAKAGDVITYTLAYQNSGGA